MSDKIKIGITIGDINGIGLEIILKTIAPEGLLNLCTPIIYANAKVINYYKNIVEEAKKFEFQVVASAIDDLNTDVVNVINCWDENVAIALGEVSETGGKYALASLNAATADLLAGHISAIVTAPIHKKAMQLAGFEYPGHTEYFGSKADGKNGLMLLCSDGLRIGVVTGHIPVEQVAQTIKQAAVFAKLETMHLTLKQDFGINKPKIAVLGLNPHAGDDGVIGTEDLKEIVPAIEAARKKGILAIGPYAADGFFGSGNYRNFDAVLAMYHDQGLVPFKTIAFGSGVNYTAGLPFIRTSPDHGTGFDIAGQDKADEASFRQALFMAIDIVRNRAQYGEDTVSPLKRHELSRERY